MELLKIDPTILFENEVHYRSDQSMIPDKHRLRSDYDQTLNQRIVFWSIPLHWSNNHGELMANLFSHNIKNSTTRAIWKISNLLMVASNCKAVNNQGQTFEVNNIPLDIPLRVSAVSPMYSLWLKIFDHCYTSSFLQVTIALMMSVWHRQSKSRSNLDSNAFKWEFPQGKAPSETPGKLSHCKFIIVESL